jgi:acetoin utilization deacetylase AcuC-like enzyme
MLLYSESYRVLTAMMMDAADRLCDGKLVVVHEGGYSEAYVPFCGQAVVETLAGVRTRVVDPEVEMFALWQPDDRINGFYRQLVDEMAQVLLG